MTTDKVTALKRTALFNELDDVTLSVLAEHAVPRHYRKDEALFLADEVAHGLFVIVSGSVQAFNPVQVGMLWDANNLNALLKFPFSECKVIEFGRRSSLNPLSCVRQIIDQILQLNQGSHRSSFLLTATQVMIYRLALPVQYDRYRG